jgi:hypothetical protein
MRKCVVSVFVLAAALLLSPFSSATTAPAGKTYIPVVITDKGITVISPFPDSGDTGQPRGVTAYFDIVNKGKRPHSFVFLGKSTGKLEPGKKTILRVWLGLRGRFAYKSKLDPGRAFRGDFTVY